MWISECRGAALVTFQSTVEGECLCRGDPHCYGFDSNPNDPSQELYITNVCSYTMVTDKCGSTDSEGFSINAEFERAKGTSAKSYVSAVEVVSFLSDEGDALLRLEQGMVATINHEEKSIPGTYFDIALDYSAPIMTGAKDFPEGTTVVLQATLPNDIVIQYDGIKSMKIITTGSNVCGICGNNDGVLDTADYTAGLSTTNDLCPMYSSASTPYTQTSNPDDFVNSWFHGAFGASCDTECGESLP